MFIEPECSRVAHRLFRCVVVLEFMNRQFRSYKERRVKFSPSLL